MRIQPSPSYLIASGLWNIPFAETRKQRAHQHDRTPQSATVLLKSIGLQIIQVDIICLEGVRTFAFLLDFNAQVFQDGNKFIDINYIRYVIDCDFFGRQQHGTQDLQGLVLCSLGGDFPMELNASFYSECPHVKKKI